MKAHLAFYAITLAVMIVLIAGAYLAAYGIWWLRYMTPAPLPTLASFNLHFSHWLAVGAGVVIIVACIWWLLAAWVLPAKAEVTQ